MARRARGGRAGRAAAREATAEPRKPYITRKIPEYSVLNDTDLAQLEANADTILEDIGIDIKEDQETIDIFVAAGAKVDGERVQFPRGMLREIVQKTAPKQFTQHARNPENNVEIGGKNTVLVPAYGSPFVYSKEGGRRYATIEDFRNFVKLAYMSPNMHHSGGTIANLSICRSISVIMIWSIPISNIPIRPLWVLSPRRDAPWILLIWPRSFSAMILSKKIASWSI